MLTNEQAAYMAAAIDGEGHIGLCRVKPDPAKWKRSAQFAFVIKITNTNRAWLEKLQQWCNGSMYSVAKKGDNRRPCYDLRFRSEEAKALLIRVMPYLLMKQRQAQLVLRYFELAAERRATSVNARPADAKIVAAQQAIHDEIRALNLSRLKQGTPGPTPKHRGCSVDGCVRLHYGRGYCWIHYRKYIVRGGPAQHQKQCVECGRAFVSKRADAKCCSPDCTDKRYYRLHAERIKAQVKANRQRRRQSDKDAPLPAASN